MDGSHSLLIRSQQFGTQMPQGGHPPHHSITWSPLFAERDLWNMSSRLDHSGFAPENLITLLHFSVSSAMSLPKSVGDPGSMTPPSSASRALILESVRKHQAGLQSFRSMRRIEASRRNASALRLRFSQSF